MRFRQALRWIFIGVIAVLLWIAYLNAGAGAMRRYFAKSCPRCGNYVRITMRKPQKNAPVQAVDGRCAACSYRLAWLVLKGNKPGLLKTSFVPSPSP